jgi:hypothetical protein
VLARSRDDDLVTGWHARSLYDGEQTFAS